MNQLGESVRWGAVAALGIAVLLSVAYRPSLGYPYVQDAVPAAERNGVVERGDWGEIFRSHYWRETASRSTSLYRPTTVLSFALERGADRQANPATSHRNNVLFHGVSAFMLFVWLSALLRRVGWPPLVAAWLFAAHPLGLHAAASVAGRADALALALSLTTLILAARARGVAGNPGLAASLIPRLTLWASGLALFLALGAKESAWALPLVLLAQEWLLFVPRSGLAVANRLAVWALAAGVALHLRVQAIGEFPGLQVIPPEDNVLVGLEGATKIWTALGMAGRYLALAVWPAALSGDYSGTAIAVESSPLSLWPGLGILGLTALAALAVSAPILSVRRPRPAASTSTDPPPISLLSIASLCAVWILTSYLLVGNLLVLNAAGFAERLIYIPLAGGIALAAVGMAGVGAAGVGTAGVGTASAGIARVAVAIAAVIALIGSLHARSEARMWESDRALFEHSVSHVPRSLRSNMALAHGHRREGRTEIAADYFRAMVEAAPEDPGSWSDFGIFEAQRGDYPAAREALERATELGPDQGAAWVWLGAVLRRLQQPEQAERALRIGTALRPDIALGLEELGDHHFRRGAYEKALELWSLPAARNSQKLEPLRAEAERRLRAERKPTLER